MSIGTPVVPFTLLAVFTSSSEFPIDQLPLYNNTLIYYVFVDIMYNVKHLLFEGFRK